MALQIWLPLNGSLNNQGLDGNAVIQNSGATINTEGKIGSCYAFDGTQKIAITSTYLQNYLCNPSVMFSMVCWIYLNTDETDRAIIFGNYSSNPFLNWELTNTCQMRLCAGGISNFTDAHDLTIIPKTIWTHLAVTYDGNKIEFYINGEKTRSVDAVNTITAKLQYSTFYLGGDYRNDATRFKGRLNDFRFYDNVLSPREIKLISQGLVCHYPLNREGFGQDNIIPNTWPEERTFEYPETSYSDKFSPITTIIPTASKYTLSFWAKSTVAGDQIRTHFYSPNTTTTCVSSQGITKTATDGNIDFTLSTEWKRYWVTYSQSDTTAVKHVICPRMGAVGNTQGICYGTGTVSIKGIKLEEGDAPTPWVPNREDTLYSAMGLDDNIVYDTSGYQNNGELYTTDGTGEFIWESDTPKYNVSCHIHSLNSTTNAWAGTAYIRANCGLVEPEQLTIAFWCYARAEGYGGNTNQGVFCTTNNTGDATGSDYQTSAMNHRDTSVNINRITDTSQLLLGMTFTADEWHHYAFTYDGQYARSYKDGALFDTKSFSDPVALNSFSSVVLGLSRAGGVWRRNNNNYSDLRVYATCLSADDISALYNTSASLTSSCVLLSNEIQEV